MANPLCELEDVNELREFVKTDEFKELEKSVENEIGAEKLQLLREMCMEAVLLCRHKDKDGELPPGMFEEFVDKVKMWKFSGRRVEY
uniref:Ovule protein n=1 Tax=Bursaphelenchus xylophilus TaxID=6326 RepID=A0A1I7SE71_BURXY